MPQKNVAKKVQGSGRNNRISSPNFKHYERLLEDGYPQHKLQNELTVYCTEMYDNEKQGIVDEWIRSRGTDLAVEGELSTGARKLEKTLAFLEHEWTMHGKHSYQKELDEKFNPKRNALRTVVFLLIVMFVGAVGVVGVDELQRKVVPQIMDFLRDTQTQNHQRQYGGGNNNNNNNAAPPPTPDQNQNGTTTKSLLFFIPDPPHGYSSWFMYFMKHAGIRERVFSLRTGNNANAIGCRCGDYSPLGSAFDANNDDGSEIDDSVQKASKRQDEEGKEKEEGGDDDEEKQKSTTRRKGEEAESILPLDEEELAPKQPSPAGRRFISQASKVFRKASGMMSYDDSGENDNDHQSSGEGGSSAAAAPKRRRRRRSYIEKGVLQPAFLLEGHEASYRTHLDWLATRFDPPIRVIDLSWSNIESEDAISDFLFWQTGWGSGTSGTTVVSGSSTAAATSSSSPCCTIFSIPHAIAPVTRIRNATRVSALPSLVERLTSVASEKAYQVQGNAGCKVMVVARVDPMSDEIKSKVTYKRMKKMFSSSFSL